MKNKIAKQSYFIKRLRNSGYIVDKVFDRYSTIDVRAWTVLINPKDSSVFCTCYSNHGEGKNVDSESRAYFEFNDGGQFIPNRVKIDTNSIEVVIQKLIEFGIQPKNITKADALDEADDDEEGSDE